MRSLPNGVPASYPTAKLQIVENPALFEKLETEALFFAFYYQPDSFQQYLAARELKRQSWRYHKQHGAWFQVLIFQMLMSLLIQHAWVRQVCYTSCCASTDEWHVTLHACRCGLGLSFEQAADCA